jgi:hypothetical protein
MTSRDVTDGERHGQNRQPKCQGDAQQADPDIRERGGQHGASASPEDQPEGSDELSTGSFAKGHDCASFSHRKA